MLTASARRRCVLALGLLVATTLPSLAAPPQQEAPQRDLELTILLKGNPGGR